MEKNLILTVDTRWVQANSLHQVVVATLRTHLAVSEPGPFDNFTSTISVKNLDWSIRPFAIWMQILGANIEEVSTASGRRIWTNIWNAVALLVGFVTWFILLGKVNKVGQHEIELKHYI